MAVITYPVWPVINSFNQVLLAISACWLSLSLLRPHKSDGISVLTLLTRSVCRLCTNIQASKLTKPDFNTEQQGKSNS